MDNLKAKYIDFTPIYKKGAGIVNGEKIFIVFRKWDEGVFISNPLTKNVLIDTSLNSMYL